MGETPTKINLIPIVGATIVTTYIKHTQCTRSIVLAVVMTNTLYEVLFMFNKQPTVFKFHCWHVRPDVVVWT